MFHEYIDMYMDIFQELKLGSLLITLCLIALTIIYYFNVRRAKTFPPGPPFMPILGSFPFLPDKSPEDLMEEYAQKYGNIFSIKFGSKWAITLSKFQTIKAAFVGQSIDFASRADEERHKAFNPHNKGIFDAHYSDSLKGRRQFVLHTLKYFGFGKRTMGSLIQEEVQQVISTFGKYRGRTFNPKPFIHMGVANTICSLLFGRRFQHDDKEFSAILTSITKMFAIWLKNPTGDYVPIFRLAPSYKETIKEFKECTEAILRFIRKEIREHEESFDPDNLRDLTDASLLESMKSKSDAVSKDQIEFILMDFFTGGSDTITVTMQWALLFMVNNPDVQRKVQAEIDAVTEEKGEMGLSLDNKHDLPYTEATIQEIQRLASVVPMGVFRATTTTTKLNGFSIPNSTWVVPNLWGVARDPSLWKEPETFNPDRFLDEQGKVTRPEFWIPFGMGRRSCPGENLARQELFLFLCGILKQFTLVSRDGAPLPEKRLLDGVVVGPQPYEIKAVIRQNEME